MLDPVEFGKSMAAIVNQSVAPLLKRIEQLESRQLQKGDDGRNGVDGKDGASITAADVAPMIESLIAKAVAELPPPLRGEAGPQGIQGEPGMAGINGQSGERGLPGEPGRDAEPIDVVEVVRELVRCPEIVPILAMQAAEAVAKHVETHPIRDGKDGRDGERGAPGEVGRDGANGRDGLDLKDLFRAEGGRLVAVMSDGNTKDLGEFVGKDGKDGKPGVDGTNGVDGLGFDDCEASVADGVVTLKYSRGTVVKTVSYPVPEFKHIGFWGSGMSAKAGNFTTHDGQLWLAKSVTSETPSYQSTDWQLAARKGVDGQRGNDGKDFTARTPTKVNGNG